MFSLQHTNLIGVHERQPKLAFVDPLGGEHLARKRDGRIGVQLGATAIDDLDVDHPPLLPPLRSRLLRVQLVRLDDPLNELVPDDILMSEADERDPGDAVEDVLYLNEA